MRSAIPAALLLSVLAAPAAVAEPAGPPPPASDGVTIPPAIEEAAAGADDIRGLHGPVEIRSTPWGAIFAGAAALGLCAAGALLLSRLNRRKRRPATPEALAAERLALARRHLDANRPREYAIESSDALRAYLEAVYGLHASKQTSDEFLRALLRAPDAVRDHEERLHAFMTACDAAKFGRRALSRPEMEKMHAAAAAVIERRAA